MIKLAVVYRKSPLQTLAEELPELMLRYQEADKQRAFQREIIEDKQEHQIKLQTDSNNFQAELSLYRDAKAESNKAEQDYNALFAEYRSTGGDLDSLNELYKSKNAIAVLDNITEVPANDYKKRAEFYEKKASDHAKKSQILSDVLYDDLFKAKQVISGGSGPAGGHIPGLWDIGDIDYQAYVKMYGPNPLVQKFFDNVPGSIEQSLSTLQLGELSKKIKQGSLLNQINKSKEAKSKQEGSDANLYLGTRIKNSAIMSGLDDYYTYQGVIANPGDYTEDAITSAKEQSLQISSQITRDLAYLTGVEFDPGKSVEEQTSGLFRMFIDAHKLARGRYTPGLGEEALPSFGHFESMIEDAYRTYQLLNVSERPQFNEAARRIFGIDKNISFEQFVDDYEKYREDALFEDLDGSSGNILDDDEKESGFWESFFDEN